MQVPGAIGDDAAYVFTGDPFLPGPGADLDFYRFTIKESGSVSFSAEVFAGRVGSALDAGLTLFRIVDGQAVLVAGNHNSLNRLEAGNAVPLLTDPVLFASLEAGEYVIVVSADENALDPNFGQAPGFDTYDPLTSHSATLGQTTGVYVLNLMISTEETAAPSVTKLDLGTTGEALAAFQVEFSASVNLPSLINATVNQAEVQTTFAVYVESDAGERWYPRLEDYNDLTHTASFLMLDRLPSGTYTLHLSGGAGLAGKFGTPLTGNTRSGDFVVPFAVTVDPAGDVLVRTLENADDSFAQPNDLGAFFVRELLYGITVTRDFTGQETSDDADYYQFTVVQAAEYVFQLQGDGLNVPGRPVLLGADGAAVTEQDGDNPFLRVLLTPGTYMIRVEWDAGAVPNAVYQLHISLGTQFENPTPLTQGPAPAFRLQLLTMLRRRPLRPSLSMCHRRAATLRPPR